MSLESDRSKFTFAWKCGILLHFYCMRVYIPCKTFLIWSRNLEAVGTFCEPYCKLWLNVTEWWDTVREAWMRCLTVRTRETRPTFRARRAVRSTAMWFPSTSSHDLPHVATPLDVMQFNVWYCYHYFWKSWFTLKLFRLIYIMRY
jgi:hypothetical protein